MFAAENEPFWSRISSTVFIRVLDNFVAKVEKFEKLFSFAWTVTCSCYSNTCSVVAIARVV